MAKVTIEYDIRLGDHVWFYKYPGSSDEVQHGVVQDISQLPDVFVEGFHEQSGQYIRWRRGIDELHWDTEPREDAGVTSKLVFEENEAVGFVHNGDVGTPEYGDLSYRYLATEFKPR